MRNRLQTFLRKDVIMAVQTEMMSRSKNRQHGIALIFCLIALLILTAITTSLVLMSTTDTVVNGNYRSEETAFFAAKAGVYEAMDRMQQSNTNSISALIPTTTNGVLYITNSGSSLTVQPWTLTNSYYDDELCHEGITIGSWPTTAQILPPDVPCTSLPSSTTWHTSVTSNYPWSGTAAAIPYEWVRITWKQNSSEKYVTGIGTSAASAAYAVNSSGATGTSVCWSGSFEVLLAAGDANCGLMQSGTPATADTPVYLITALAVTPNGSRHMVQADVAIPPPLVISNPGGFSDPDGFFTDSTACGSSGGSAPFVLSGGATTDGYNSSNGGTYASTKSNSLGSVGSDGSVLISGGSTKVGGNIHVLHTAVNGSCGPPATGDVYTNGGATYTGVVPIASYTPPVPSIPAAGTANVTNPNTPMVPGSYQNIKMTGGNTLTLTAPGIYNINCISLSGNSILQISPANKQVVINVTGNSCTSNAPVDLSGGTVTNSSGIAANLIINYAGNQQVKLTGGSSTYMVVNAPNASAALSGGSDFFGAIVVASMNDSGGTNLHFDNALTTAPSSGTTTSSTFNSSYSTLSFRSVPY
jgi:Tfp pilus assembly protein PilX